MFRASLCTSSGAYQLQQQQPLVYCGNVAVAVLLAVVGPVAGNRNVFASNKPVINCCIWLVDSFECVKMHGPTNPKVTQIYYVT